MLKTLLFCAVLCGLPFPALAGERSGVSVRAMAFAGLIKDPAALRASAPSADGALPQRFMLPAGDARLERLPQAPLTGENRPVPVTVPADWGPAPEATARAGGSYAVYDIMEDLPKRRHRKSPLSAAFVLRLDGNVDSPAFSVGGGGVAAAVWQAVPK